MNFMAMMTGVLIAQLIELPVMMLYSYVFGLLLKTDKISNKTIPIVVLTYSCNIIVFMIITGGRIPSAPSLVMKLPVAWLAAYIVHKIKFRKKNGIS